MTGTLYTALALFMRDAGRQKGTYDEYVQKSIEYISSQYSYHITVEEIAQYAGVSRSHLFQRFSELSRTVAKRISDCLPSETGVSSPENIKPFDYFDCQFSRF